MSESHGLLWSLAHIIGYIWDRLTFIPWYMLTDAGEKLRLANRAKSVPVNGKVDGHWKSGDTERLVETYYRKKTMDAIFSNTCKKFTNCPALGTRELLSEVDEKQPNGKIFKKAIYGDYKWQTFGEIDSKVDDFARGLSSLGIRRVAIFMETRADWMIAAQACFRHNIRIITVYATLGEAAVNDALIEAETEHLITSASLVDSKLGAILVNNKDLKTVIYAAHENPSQKIKFKKPEDSKLDVCTYNEIYEMGQNTTIKAPEPPKPETIAVIMYTSGTSGKAKGVMISQANIVAACSGIGERLQVYERFSPKDCFIGYLPLAHILEFAAENCVLFNGARVGYSSPLTLSDRSTRIKKGSKGDCSVLKPTLMVSVPEILERIRKGKL